MKIGNYTIPDIRLFPKLAEWVYDLLDNFQLEEIENQEAMAKICGHKTANSGAWISKLADMRLYGLIEKRSLRVTELAEALVSGTDQERQKATNEAILNVPLWKALYDKYKKNPPEDTFWIQIQRLTGVNNLLAQKHADTIRKAYLSDVSYIVEEIEENQQVETTTTQKDEPTNDVPSDVVGKIIAYGYGEIDIKDKLSFEIAKSYLRIFADKLGITEPNKT